MPGAGRGGGKRLGNGAAIVGRAYPRLMSNPATILLVDDEEAVQKLLAYPLERDGYRVVQARDGDEALRQFEEHSVDLVVLDLMLPKLDGLEVCKRLRAVSHVPIIMLTARDDEVDKVLGLELGADDYITKPFSIREFRSRVKAALRRAAAPKHDADGQEAISIDGLVVDPARRAVEMNGEPVELTYVEFELLSTLASQARPRVQPAGAARRALGRLRVPRSAHDRRPRAPPAREARADAERAAVHPDSARRRLPLPRRVNPFPQRRCAAQPRAAALRDCGAGPRLRGSSAVAGEPARQLTSERPRAQRAGTGAASSDKPLAASEDFFERAARTTNARVALLRPLSKAPEWTMNVLEDSQGGGSSSDIRTDPVAINTSRDLAPRRSTVTRDGVRYAEVAVPVGGDGTVLLLSASLARALGDVSLVKRRLLIAGGVVLALVFVVGYALAWVFARRIRRLERAADRIANGMFDEPVVDTGQDEVGELARAFERMRRRLAQLDHARREFIANASHELRTPVFSLGGFLELLDDEELDEETRREFLTTMREQVQRLEKLATELLDLSRLDAGHIDLDREAVALDEVAQTAAAEFTAVALQSGHDLEVDARRRSSRSRTSSACCRSRRILLENALVHTPGGTHVRIEVNEDRGRARLAVIGRRPGDRRGGGREHLRALLSRGRRASLG